MRWCAVSRRAVSPYVEALLASRVVLFGEQLKGAVAFRGAIDLHLTALDNGEDVITTLAHEVVHIVEPDLPEGAVQARALWLARQPKFRSVAAWYLAEALVLLWRRYRDGRPYIAEVHVADQ